MRLCVMFDVCVETRGVGSANIDGETKEKD